VSNPTNAGDPIITAIVMIMPKTMPTKTNRLFIKKKYLIPVKKQRSGKESGRIL